MTEKEKQQLVDLLNKYFVTLEVAEYSATLADDTEKLLRVYDEMSAVKKLIRTVKRG